MLHIEGWRQRHSLVFLCYIDRVNISVAITVFGLLFYLVFASADKLFD